MNHLVRISGGMAAAMLLLVTEAIAQQAGGTAGRTAAARPAAAKPAAAKPAAEKPAAEKPAAEKPVSADGFIATRSIYRVLAPGVVEPIPRAVISDETVNTHDVTELVTQDSTFTWAKDVPFHQDVWMLDFEFKPVRMVWVDVPAAEGRMERKLVWYMVYKVTNSGDCLHPVEDEGQEFYEGNRVYKLTAVDKPVRFIPVFTMEVHNRLKDETPGSAKLYNEKYIPIALPTIRAREDKNRQFLSTIEMPKKQIAFKETVWGVVTWEGIDPRNVWFSVYVEGLTNAYRWKDDPAKYVAALDAAKERKRGPAYRELFGKALQLNFWRIGDEYTLKEDQIRYGVPGMLNYEWVWRRVF
jgi:hypothetical protein